MFGTSKSVVVGPHVIEPTNKIIITPDGNVTKWECKYCGATGTRPGKGPTNLAWTRDCDKVEILESERESLTQ